MKHLLKYTLIAALLFSGAASSQAQGSPISGPLISVKLFNNYTGKVYALNGSALNLLVLALTVYPNGYVEGTLTTPNRHTPDSDGRIRGRSDNKGNIDGNFYRNGKWHRIKGNPGKGTLGVYAERGSRALAKIIIDPDGEDFAPKTLGSGGTIETFGNGDSFYFDYNAEGNGNGEYHIADYYEFPDYGSEDHFEGNITYRRLGKNRALVTLTYDRGEGDMQTHTLVIFYQGEDYGVVYDVEAGEFKYWDSTSYNY